MLRQIQTHTHQVTAYPDVQVRIVEQPAKYYRFRYSIERSAGILFGESHTIADRKYPAIEISNYEGPLAVIVSCVTDTEPYWPHPYNIIGETNCKDGVYYVRKPSSTNIVQLTDVSIERVSRSRLDQSLARRKQIRVDPFQTGFSHTQSLNAINLSTVRLAFQVYLKDVRTGKCTVPLKPIISEPIHNTRLEHRLNLSKISHCCFYADGRLRRRNGTIIALCEDHVTKNDLKVRFFEMKGNKVVWEEFIDFEVHNGSSLFFNPPKYHNLSIEDSVKVFVQLVRPSDGMTSKSVPFEILPIYTEAEIHRRRQIQIGQLQGIQFSTPFTWNMPQEKKIANTDPQPSTSSQDVTAEIAIAPTAEAAEIIQVQAEAHGEPEPASTLPEAAILPIAETNTAEPASTTTDTDIDIDDGRVELRTDEACYVPGPYMAEESFVNMARPQHVQNLTTVNRTNGTCGSLSSNSLHVDSSELEKIILQNNSLSDLAESFTSIMSVVDSK